MSTPPSPAPDQAQRPRPSPSDLLAQWQRYFADPLLSLAALQGEAERGVLFDKRGLRSLSWRFFLGLLPAPAPLPSSPPAAAREPYKLLLTQQRSAYTQLRERYLRSPDGRWVADGDGEGAGVTSGAVGEVLARVEDLRVNNPLGLDEENPWTGWFRDVELRKEIRKDVQRTFPEVDYFRLSTTQDRMTDLLFIWCKLAPEIGYRQGMHELLAPLLWFVDYDSLSAPSPSDEPEGDLAHVVLAREWVEHDAWALFSTVMHPARAFYDHTPSASPSPRASGNPTPPTTLVQPIVALSAHVHSLLSTLDPPLAHAFTRLGVEPQLYTIRWFRLLFSREFPLPATLTLWDGLLAADPSLRLVTHVALALLLRARGGLLAAAKDGDYGAFVQTLLRYPACGDRSYKTELLLQQALYLRDHASPAGAAHVRGQNAALGAALGGGDEAQEEDEREEPSPLARPTNGHGHRRAQTAGGAQALGFFGGEGLVGDLAKGVLARGEALGINKALRGTLDEIKRGVAEAQSLADERRRARPTSSTSGFSQLPTRAPWDAPRSLPPPAPPSKDPLAELAAMRAASAGMAAAVAGAVGVLERALGEGRGEEVEAALDALRRVGEVLGGRTGEVVQARRGAQEGTPGGSRSTATALAARRTDGTAQLAPASVAPSTSTKASPAPGAAPPAAGTPAPAPPASPPSARPGSSDSATVTQLASSAPSLYLSSRTEKPLPSLSRTPQPSPSLPPPNVARPASSYPPAPSPSSYPPAPSTPTYPPPRSPAPAPAAAATPSFPSAGFSVRPPPSRSPAPTPAPTADPLGVLSSS